MNIKVGDIIEYEFVYSDSELGPGLHHGRVVGIYNNGVDIIKYSISGEIGRQFVYDDEIKRIIEKSNSLEVLERTFARFN